MSDAFVGHKETWHQVKIVFHYMSLELNPKFLGFALLLEQ